MVIFPNCKINLGLNILDKRKDGFHNLQSIFIPVQWCDVLEIIESECDEIFVYGNDVATDSKNNTCFKALQILRSVRKFPAVQIHLLKNIPMGAGLGGGSSDGAFTLKLLNEKFNLGFSLEELKIFATQIGSDCAFFIENEPMLVEGRGEKISPINFSLKEYSVAIIYPEVHVDTAFAYKQLSEFRKKNITEGRKFSVENFLQSKTEEWRNNLFNNFEEVIFPLHHEIKKWKDFFYNEGAIISLMSGSGSSVFALFKKNEFPDLEKFPELEQVKFFQCDF
ncbi:MAG: 4-(cytidine 5'-diphospho)-2-C-methyl-D-erythritol kinase [Bacteroidota bacterium]